MKVTYSSSVGDYTLNTNAHDAYTNVELTITLRLGFRQVNPDPKSDFGFYPDSNNRPQKIVQWNEAYWSRWLSSFVWSVRHYWNGRFWLKNNLRQFEFKIHGVSYIPNIKCSFDLKANAVHSGPNKQYHHVIDVVRLDPAEGYFRSHSKLYDNRDTVIHAGRLDSHKKPIMHLSHAHEIGHLLGLQHVDVGKAHCPATGDTSAAACYGVTDEDKSSIMGAGLRVRKEHALPWRRAMTWLTGKGDVTNPKDWEPWSIPLYPRTLDEADHDKLITTRVVR